MESKDRSCVSGSEIVANASATAENIIEPFAERLAKEILDDCFEALFPPASSLVAHLLHTNHCGSSDSLHSVSSCSPRALKSPHKKTLRLVKLITSLLS